MMTKKYFFDLNYSLANEDTTYEFKALEDLKLKKVLSVGGSGARCLPFLALPIEKLDIVDVSHSQILFIKIKLKAIKELTHKEFLEFYKTRNNSRRLELFSKLDPSDFEKDFFDYLNNISSHIPMLYWGKWEKTFIFFSKLIQKVMGKKNVDNFFKAEDTEKYFNDHINGIKWKSLIFLLGNKVLFNSLLYKGDFIKKNSRDSYFKYYSKAFKRLSKLNIKKSFFMQLCFKGEVLFDEALPLEFQEEIFNKIKESKAEVFFHEKSLLKLNLETDFISLSDVPCYFSKEVEREYLNILKNYKTKYICERHYLRRPLADSSSFKDISLTYEKLAASELVQMYDIKLWKLL